MLHAILLAILLGASQNDTGAEVSGTVRAPAGQRLPEMVVYLEPVDASLKFPIPTSRPEISQKGAQFAPSLLVICAGQTVVFKNDEDRAIEHNVFSRSPVKLFDLGLFSPPDERTVLFDKPGAVRLFCSIHRYMDGVIYVCPTPWYATVDGRGVYQITGVPPGSWRVKTWQKKPRFDEQSMEVRLLAGQRTNLNLEMTRK